MEVQIRSCGELYPVPKRAWGDRTRGLRPYKGGGGGHTNYRGPAAQKGAWDPILIHVFVFPAVTIFVDCTN